MLQSIKNQLLEIKEKAEYSNKHVIGYPVNRWHALNIDLSLLGLVPNALSTTYLNNLGTPYEHSYIANNSKAIEIELVRQCAQHFNLPVDDCCGYVTQGGTESNLVCLWWHREYLKKCYNQPVTLMSSEQAHYSISKAANILGIDYVAIKTTNAQINLNDLILQLNKIKTPIIFIYNIGTTQYGVIDDIMNIQTILQQTHCDKFKIHADGAIYGMFIPYISKFNKLNTVFEYVDTISFSGHKFLGCYSISSLVLARNSYINSIFENQKLVPFLHNIHDRTISGSRSGFAVIELYLMMLEAFKFIDGKQQLEIIWTKCLNMATTLVHQLKIILDCHGNNFQKEVMHNYLRVVFPVPYYNEQADWLVKKYGLMRLNNKQCGIYVFPSVTQLYLDKFIEDYQVFLNLK